MILSSASEYFERLFDSGFSESSQSVIELQDDEPEAVVAMLRFLYTFDYVDKKANLPSLDFHFEVCKTAKKYLLPKLEEKALNAISAEQERRPKDNDTETAASGIVDLFRAYDDYRHHVAPPKGQLRTLVKEHLPLLMKRISELLLWTTSTACSTSSSIALSRRRSNMLSLAVQTVDGFGLGVGSQASALVVWHTGSSTAW
jgi:hypothetical protein